MNGTPEPESPVGIASFRTLRENGAYYVDKTRFIEEFLRHGSTDVTLITRPRRFGKTLLMDTVKEFFDMSCDSSGLFEGLYAENMYQTYGHSMPVLSLSFAGISGDRDDIVTGIKDVLSEALEQMGEATQSLSPLRQEKLKSVTASINDATGKYTPINRAIRFLTEILETHYKKRVLLIIDEYDTPMQAAWLSGCYCKLRSFFSNFYGTALKGNKFVRRALMTGIQRMAKESIFSGLNNPSVCTLADAEYADCFGFTEPETKAMLECFGLSLTDEVKARYDGYRIGEAEIYNPWAIANYCDKKRIVSFWSETASGNLIREKMEAASAEFIDSFARIAQNGQARVHVNMGLATFESSDEPTLWGLLVNSGYLTFAPPEMPADTRGNMLLKIPNGDVADGFIRLLSNELIDGNVVTDMFRCLYRDRDTKSFAKEYQKIILNSTSFFSVGEEPYRKFMLGMCICMGGLYEIKADQEQGKGRSDVSMRSRSPRRFNIIMEFKYERDAEPAVLAQVALEQIRDRMYASSFEGETLLIGIGHRGKESALEFEWKNSRDS